MKTFPSVSSSIPRTSRGLHRASLLLCSLLLLAGCATSKDVTSRQDIATLKQTHLSFIDEFTEGAGKTWDEQKLTTRMSAVESQFTDAEQYEATKKKDARRSKAISILHSQWKSHAGFLQRRKTFYRAKFAGELKGQVTQNYDQALRGEDLRP